MGQDTKIEWAHYFGEEVTIRVFTAKDGTRTALINGHEYFGIRSAEVHINSARMISVTVQVKGSPTQRKSSELETNGGRGGR